MKQALIYSLKVWLTSIVISMIVIVVLNYLIRGIRVHLEDTPLAFAGLTVGSLPSMVIFFVCCRYMDNSKVLNKVILAIVAFILSAAPLIITVLIVKHSLYAIILRVVCYGLITASCSIFYSVKNSPDEASTDI